MPLIPIPLIVPVSYRSPSLVTAILLQLQLLLVVLQVVELVQLQMIDELKLPGDKVMESSHSQSSSLEVQVKFFLALSGHSLQFKFCGNLCLKLAMYLVGMYMVRISISTRTRRIPNPLFLRMSAYPSAAERDSDREKRRSRRYSMTLNCTKIPAISRPSLIVLRR